MSILAFEDYRAFLLASIRALPDNGKGELSKIAKLLQISTSFLSQVLQGKKGFSHDHAYALAKYLRLADLELLYFVELINLEKASQHDLKAFFLAQMRRIREDAAKTSGTSSVGQPLDDKNQGIFYSSWFYSAIQLATGITQYQTVEAIAERLELDRKVIKKVLEFLVETGLCVNDGERFRVGPRRTHLEKTSALRGRHHMNWRLKAMESLNDGGLDEIFFTFPVCIDEKPFSSIANKINSLIKETSKAVDDAQNTTLACLNLDWFKF